MVDPRTEGVDVDVESGSVRYGLEMAVRSMLFGPANRIDFVPKFVAAGADIGVLDLEDAVADDAKQHARDMLADRRPGATELGDTTLFVRVNSIDSEHFEADMAAAAAAAAAGIIVPKIENGDGVAAARSALERHKLADALLCAGIESALGVHNAVEVAKAPIDMAYFGAEDFITDMGGVRTESNEEVHYARSRVALAARIGGVPALDQIVANFRDESRFTKEATEARALGYQGKLCIHPSQVTLANTAFLPSPKEIEWAEGVLAAVDAADGAALISYEGMMVDTPLISRAKLIVQQSRR